MNVEDLKWLASIFDMSAVDPGAKTIVLVGNGEAPGVTAYYEGLNTGAMRSSAAIDILKSDGSPLAVKGTVLLGMLGLLAPDATIKLGRTDTTLMLRGPNTRTPLRLEGNPQIPHVFQRQENISGTARLSKAEVAPKLAVLAEATAKRMDNMVLTGVHVAAAKSKRVLALSATDLVRAAKTSVACTIEGEFTPVILPLADFNAALALMSDEFELMVGDGIVHLRSGDGMTLVRLNVFNGEFPSLDMLPRKSTYPHQMAYPASAFATVQRACALVDAGGNLVRVEIKKGRMTLSTQNTEIGSFEIDAGSTLGPAELDHVMYVDSTYLNIVSRLGDAPVLRFFPDPKKTILFEGGGIFYWMQPTAMR